MNQKVIGSIVVIAIIVIIVAVGVCSYFLLSGGGAPTPAPTITITGNVMKGPVTGATVKVYALNFDGTRGALLGTTTTDNTGTYTVSLTSAPVGPILVEASGGSYVNEVSGVTDTLSGSDTLTAVLPGGTTQAAITPLTHMAAARARALATAGISLTTAVDAANVGVAQQYNLSDILGILPVAADNATQVATSSRNQRDYGVILAGITQEAADLNVWPIDLATALANDMEDGILDGLGENPIQVPTIAGPVITLPENAGRGALQNAINIFLASGNNLTNLVGTSISTTPVNINPAGGSFYITATALPAWIEGQNGAATLTAVGGTQPYTWRVTAGSALPNWLALGQQGNNGILTGTAPLLAAGSTRSISPPFSVTCTDATGLSQAINWTVTIINAPPTLIPVAGTLTVNQYGSTQVAQAIGGTPPYYFVSTSFAYGAPPFGTVVDLNGNLIGTPGTVGTFNFGVSVVDLVGAEDSKQTSVTVNAPTVSQFDGSYTGSFSGTATVEGVGSVPVSGPVAFTVSDGVITVSGGGSGTVSSAGSTDFSGSGSGEQEGVSFSFTGTFVVSSGTASASGTWSASYTGATAISGTWSATR